jgi:FkbM family methyltransferase
MSLKHFVRRSVRRFGYDLVRYAPQSHALARRALLLRTYGIETVLDVGANAGQYGRQLRDIGYRGSIISFEPLHDAYAELQNRASADAAWQAFNVGLGRQNGSAQINVAANSYSSSVLGMLPAHLEAAPQSAYRGREEIEVRTLDSMLPRLCPQPRRMWLKIDTQGFERYVLDGAEASLRRIDTVQLEMSLLPLYDGEASFLELYEHLLRRGYEMVSIEPGFVDTRSGRLLQVDGIFHRDAGGPAGG